MTLRIGIYPGTFDPITLGHLDIIQRARRICDRLIIASAVNHSKTPFFTPEQRVAMIKASLPMQAEGVCPVEVLFFDSLLIDFARQNQANFIIRGLRTVSDFDYEFQMVGVNRTLDPHIETIFLPADMKTQFISSSLVKQIFQYGGDLKEFVPESVIRLMRNTSSCAVK